jgi:DNA-3-methyladenine glycosylase
MILPQEFYRSGETLELARNLLGKILVHRSRAGETSGRIVEVEAYCQEADPACHAARGKTRRNEQMFGPPGHAYVYFTYGMHHCFNVVVQDEGIADAILVRAVEPLEGIALMMRRRGLADERLLCSGPGRLCQAYDITLEQNGWDLARPPLYIMDDGFVAAAIESSARTGISQGKDLHWRFFLSGNKFVSRT